MLVVRADGGFQSASASTVRCHIVGCGNSVIAVYRCLCAKHPRLHMLQC